MDITSDPLPLNPAFYERMDGDDPRYVEWSKDFSSWKDRRQDEWNGMTPSDHKKYWAHPGNSACPACEAKRRGVELKDLGASVGYWFSQSQAHLIL